MRYTLPAFLDLIGRYLRFAEVTEQSGKVRVLN